MSDNLMADLFVEVAEEMIRAADLHGPQLQLPWRAGSRSQFVLVAEARMARQLVEHRSEHDCLSWADILIEEVAEAVDESDPQQARTELVQVAAMAISAIAAIDYQGRKS